MTFTIYGEAHEAQSYEKTEDSLLLFDARGTCTAAFGGISDFSGYFMDGVPLADVSEGGAQ
jgi:hypothetical protein